MLLRHIGYLGSFIHSEKVEKDILLNIFFSKQLQVHHRSWSTREVTIEAILTRSIVLPNMPLGKTQLTSSLTTVCCICTSCSIVYLNRWIIELQFVLAVLLLWHGAVVFRFGTCGCSGPRKNEVQEHIWLGNASIGTFTIWCKSFLIVPYTRLVIERNNS